MKRVRALSGANASPISGEHAPKVPSFYMSPEPEAVYSSFQNVPKNENAEENESLRNVLIRDDHVTISQVHES